MMSSLLLCSTAMQRMLSMNVMDTIMMATRCVWSDLVGWQVAVAVVARIVAVVDTVDVIVMGHVADSLGQVPPLADLTIESK